MQTDANEAKAWKNNFDNIHRTCLLQDSTRNLLKDYIQMNKTNIQGMKINMFTHGAKKKTTTQSIDSQNNGARTKI